jgi:hypothetical protein
MATRCRHGDPARPATGSGSAPRWATLCVVNDGRGDPVPGQRHHTPAVDPHPSHRRRTTPPRPPLPQLRVYAAARRKHQRPNGQVLTPRSAGTSSHQRRSRVGSGIVGDAEELEEPPDDAVGGGGSRTTSVRTSPPTPPRGPDRARVPEPQQRRLPNRPPDELGFARRAGRSCTRTC